MALTRRSAAGRLAVNEGRRHVLAAVLVAATAALPVHEGRRRGWSGLRVSRHVLTTVAVAVLSLSVLGPPVQAQDNPSAQELADLRALAEAGATEAQYSIGVKYDTGEGVPQDDAEAVIWYRRRRAGPRRVRSSPSESCTSTGRRRAEGRRSKPIMWLNLAWPLEHPRRQRSVHRSALRTRDLVA